jgi:hypothetical protein
MTARRSLFWQWLTRRSITSRLRPRFADGSDAAMTCGDTPRPQPFTASRECPACCGATSLEFVSPVNFLREHLRLTCKACGLISFMACRNHPSLGERRFAREHGDVSERAF